MEEDDFNGYTCIYSKIYFGKTKPMDGERPLDKGNTNQVRNVHENNNNWMSFCAISYNEPEKYEEEQKSESNLDSVNDMDDYNDKWCTELNLKLNLESLPLCEQGEMCTKFLNDRIQVNAEDRFHDEVEFMTGVEQKSDRSEKNSGNNLIWSHGVNKNYTWSADTCNLHRRNCTDKIAGVRHGPRISILTASRQFSRLWLFGVMLTFCCFCHTSVNCKVISETDEKNTTYTYEIPTIKDRMAFPCNETLSCTGNNYPKLIQFWKESTKTTEEKTIPRKIFTSLPIPWLKEEITINMADFKALGYGKGVRRKAAKHKKKSQDAKHHDQVSNCFGYLVVCVFLMTLSAVLLDAFLLPILHATIVKVVLCLFWMTFSTVVLYKLVDEKLIRKEVYKLSTCKPEEAARVTISERLQVLILYSISTFMMLQVFYENNRYLDMHELVLLSTIINLQIILTLWTFMVFSDLPFDKSIGFLKVFGNESRTVMTRHVRGFIQCIVDLNMQGKKKINDILSSKCFVRMNLLCYKAIFILKCLCQQWIFLKEQDVESLRDILQNGQALSWKGKDHMKSAEHDDEEWQSKKEKKEETTGNESKDFDLFQENGVDDRICHSIDKIEKETCVIDVNLLSIKESKNGYKSSILKNETDVGDDCDDSAGKDQSRCMKFGKTSFEQFIPCSFENTELESFCQEEVDSAKIDRELAKTDKRLPSNFESNCMCMHHVDEQNIEGIEHDHDHINSQPKEKHSHRNVYFSLSSSTDKIPELGAEDIHAETSLKTVMTVSHESDECIHGTVSTKVSEYIISNEVMENDALNRVHQCTEPSDIYGRIWQEADFTLRPCHAEYVKECNSLKSEYSDDSINDKCHSKYDISIGSSQSSLSFNREHMVYSVSAGSMNFSTEHNVCNDVIGSHGYREVKGCHGYNDGSLQSRDDEVDAPPRSVIDLQKQQESKARLASRKKYDGKVKQSVGQPLDEEHLQKVVENTIEKIFKDTLKNIPVRKSGKSHNRRPTSGRYRRAVRRVLRRAIHHNRYKLSPASVNGNVFPSEQQSNNNTVDNKTVVATPNGALAGISLDRPPIALSVPTSSSSLNNYFTKVLKGYNFDQDERMMYEMLRVQSFQDLPASCVTSPLRMANTGFFSRGNGDEVTCFSCGKQYKNWSQTDLPSEVHRRISPNCRMVKGTDPRNVPIAPQTNAFAAHNSVLDSLPNNASGFIQTTHSTVHQDGDISTPTVPENRPLTRQELDNANVPDRTQQPGRVGVEGQQRRPPQRDQAEELGIVLDRPKYPSYAQLNVRVSTFSGWPGYLDQSPRDMALAGFFYAGYNDYCRCFYCGGGLRNWDAGDDPWVEHARWFPKCSFVRQNRGHRFVEIITKRHAEMQASGGTAGSKTQTTTVGQGSDNSGSGSPSTSMSAPQTKTQTQQQPQASAAIANDQNESAIQSVRELGYTEQVIRRAIDIMKGNNPGKSKFEAAEILEVVFTITDDETTPTNNAVVSENSENTAISRQQSPNTSNIKQQSQNQRGSQSRQQPQTGSQSRQTGKGKKSKSKQKSSGTANQSSTEMSLPSLSVSSLETANAAGGANLDPTSNPAISDSEIRSLQEENIQLKEQVMCKICMDKNVSIAFLPCGHLACCIDCAPAMRKCPMCRVFIKGTVKTYLA